MKNAGEQHVLNSITTMVIFALSVPLMFYFGLKGFFDAMGTIPEYSAAPTQCRHF